MAAQQEQNHLTPAYPGKHSRIGKFRILEFVKYFVTVTHLHISAFEQLSCNPMVHYVIFQQNNLAPI